MRKEKSKATITVRLTGEEHEALRRLCVLKKTTQTGYLAHLARNLTKRELLDYAVHEYLKGEASLSELAKRTGLEVPAIMDEVARVSGEDRRAVEAFLSAVKTLSKLSQDPSFYDLAVKAVKSSPSTTSLQSRRQ